MKKIFIYIVAMIAMVGCQKSDPQQEVLPKGQTLTALAPGAGQNVGSKVYFEEDGITANQINAKWEVGDVITLFEEADGSYENSGNWQVESVSSDGEATFVISSDNENKLSENSSYCAVYPASSAATIADWDSEKIYATAVNQSEKHQSQKSNDDMSHLDDKLRMKTMPFSPAETMNFEHKTAIMTLDFKSWERVSDIVFVDNLTDAGQQRYYITKFDDDGSVSLKIHFMIDANLSTYHKIAFQSVTSSNYFEKIVNFAFVEGKHYVWETNPAMPTSVTLDKSSAMVAPGGELQLSATVLPENVRNKSVAWKSSNSNVATVDENGLVAVKEDCAAGATATITATSKLDNTISGDCEITVMGGDVLTLATFDLRNPPASNIWTFADYDATADSKEDFEDLRFAIRAAAEDEVLYINFPNLTQIPNSAFVLPPPYKYKASCNISAPQVLTIGDDAFNDVGRFTVDMPKVETIGDNAFYASELIGEYTFENLTSVGIGAFKYSDITKLSLPNITTVPVGLVSFCDMLTELHLPKVVEIVEDILIMSKCYNLTKLTIATTASTEFTYYSLSYITPEKIDLVTHADNIWYNDTENKLYNGYYYEKTGYYYKTTSKYVGPFKSITTP